MNCGRDYDGCEWVRWGKFHSSVDVPSAANACTEHHPDWETIVNMSFASDRLGKQGVENLEEVLFPRDLYPNKYDHSGDYRG
jgi:hypothetical protein